MLNFEAPRFTPMENKALDWGRMWRARLIPRHGRWGRRLQKAVSHLHHLHHPPGREKDQKRSVCLRGRDGQECIWERRGTTFCLQKKSEDSVMWPQSLYHHQGRQAAGRPRGRCVVPNPHVIILYLYFVFTWMLCLCIVYFGLTSAQREYPHYWKELGFSWKF